MSLDLAEEKWYRKTIDGFKYAWVTMVQKAESFDAFVKGVAAISRIPEDIIRSSLPAIHWKEFQANASKYLDKALAKIEAAYRAHKWSTKYKTAFQRTGK